ncbi:catabolic L-serine/threonine dehydratase [Pestalotiopsis sp. IQ-011]
MTTDTKQQRTVLITGCSEGGIGFALAQEFHNRGLRVFATARNLSKVEHLRALVGVEIVQLDVADKASVRAAADEVAKLTGGRLDYLVNNAGAGYQCPLLDADLDEGRKLFEVNIWGLLAVTQAFAPLLVETAAKGGKPRVVNIGSIVSRVNVPWGGLYNASKGALSTLNDALRMELRPLGVGVLHVITGGVSTKFYGNSAGQKLPEGSVYTPIAADIEKAVAGHTASSLQTMTPETYARKVVSNVLSSWPTMTYWIGGQTWIGYLGVKFGWDSIRDLVIGYMTGMHALRQKYLAATRGNKA